TLVLAGLFPRLQDAQMVIFQGNVYDPSVGGSSATLGVEIGTLDGGPVTDAENNITTVKIKPALTRQYARASAVLLANIATATHGETVRDEALGSGNGAAFQSFPLKQKPLTYLPATDPEGLSSVQSTLLVTVNGVSWQEQPTLLESAPNAQEFTTNL